MHTYLCLLDFPSGAPTCCRNYLLINYGENRFAWGRRPDRNTTQFAIEKCSQRLHKVVRIRLIGGQSDLFTEIALYDIVHVPGIAVDLNHIDTTAKVYGYLPDDNGLRKTLAGAEIVVVTAGMYFQCLEMPDSGLPVLCRHCAETWNDSRRSL